MTLSYYFMLLFVFITLMRAQRLMLPREEALNVPHAGLIILHRLVWPLLGVYFFHCTW